MEPLYHLNMGSKSFEQALSKLRAICLALPETREVEAWGHPTFRAGTKMFAACGGEKSDFSLGIKVGHDWQAELLNDERFFPTPYAAHQGWVSLRVDKETDWDEVAALVREAYRQVALKRMVSALDAPPR
jgi:predicted DNA-binding protein (MmcQ/YjbR family)